MEELTGIKTYKEFEQRFDNEVTNQAESFVRLGYLLKIARDTEILHDSGYKTVAEFAKQRYGLEKDIVSRYININDRFAQNGYSDHLAEQFKGFGYSKLAIMLTLPDTVVDALTPQMSKNAITEVQKGVKEEQKIPPLDVLLEEKNPGQQELKTDLQKFVHQFGYDNREKVRALVNATAGDDFVEKIMDVLAPGGIAMLSARIPGRGKMMLSIKGKDNKLTLLDIRANDSFDWLWEDLREDIQTVYQDGTEETWERIYHEQFKPGNQKEEKQVEKEHEKQPKQEEPVEKESKTAIQEQHDSKKERKEIDAKNGNVKEDSIHRNDEEQSRQVEKSTDAAEEENKQTMQDDGKISGGRDSIVTLKPESVPKQPNTVRKSQEVAPVQPEMDDKEIAVLSEFTYAAIKKYRDILISLEEYTEKTIKKALHKTTEGSEWVKFEVEDTVYSTQVDDIDSIETVSVYTENYKLTYTWNLSDIYEEIAAVINEDEDALKEEQIPGQAHINDIQEIQPDHKEVQNDFVTMAFRCLPGDIVYFTAGNKVEEAKVTEVTVREDLIPAITVKATDTNTFVAVEFNQKDDWGVSIFKSREAAEWYLTNEEARRDS